MESPSLFAPLTYGLGQFIQDGLGLIPADTGIGNTLAIGETYRTTRHVLAATYQVTFQHDTKDALIPGGDLISHILSHNDLAFGLLFTIGMTAIDH
jgi:hypothetical protein